MTLYNMLKVMRLIKYVKCSYYFFRLKIKGKRCDKIGTIKKHIINAIPAPVSVIYF